LPNRGVNQANHAFAAGQPDAVPVRTEGGFLERQACSRCGVTSADSSWLRLKPGGRQLVLVPADLPDFCGSVFARSKDEPAVGRKRYGVQDESMANRQADR
jgi:hypothetical protein